MASIYKRLSSNEDSQSGSGPGSNVVVTASVLPAGAATSALQVPANNSLASIDAKTPALVSGSVPVTGPLTDTQLRATPVDVTVIGGGDATSANQVIGNNSLASIDSKLTAPLSTTALTDTQLRATPVPVSGTVTSNIGTTGGLALDATLTGGTAKSIVRGGAKGSTVAGDVTSTSITANIQALDVQIQNTSIATTASQSGVWNVGITGTPTITGTVSVSNFPATQQVSGTGNFTVVQPTGTNLHTVVDSGNITLATGANVIGSISNTAFTANAGTNLNTSALNLEATQAAMAANIALILANQTNGLQQAKITDMNGTGPLFYDLDTTGAPAYAVGVSLRRTTAGTPVEVGTTTTPLFTSFPNYTAYSATAALSSALLPTDIFNMSGSATKTVFITKVRLSGTTTAGSGISTNTTLVKRSTANSGGGINAITIGSYSSAYAASGASARYYTTTNPTLGTAIAAIRADRYSFVTAGTAIPNLIWEFDFNNPTKALILIGTTENVSINLGGTTITGSQISVTVEWFEV